MLQSIDRLQSGGGSAAPQLSARLQGGQQHISGIIDLAQLRWRAPPGPPAEGAAAACAQPQHARVELSGAVPGAAAHVPLAGAARAQAGMGATSIVKDTHASGDRPKACHICKRNDRHPGQVYCRRCKLARQRAVKLAKETTGCAYNNAALVAAICARDRDEPEFWTSAAWQQHSTDAPMKALLGVGCCQPGGALHAASLGHSDRCRRVVGGAATDSAQLPNSVSRGAILPLGAGGQCVSEEAAYSPAREGEQATPAADEHYDQSESVSQRKNKTSHALPCTWCRKLQLRKRHRLVKCDHCKLLRTNIKFQCRHHGLQWEHAVVDVAAAAKPAAFFADQDWLSGGARAACALLGSDWRAPGRVFQSAPRAVDMPQNSYGALSTDGAAPDVVNNTAAAAAGGAPVAVADVGAARAASKRARSADTLADACLSADQEAGSDGSPTAKEGEAGPRRLTCQCGWCRIALSRVVKRVTGAKCRKCQMLRDFLRTRARAAGLDWDVSVVDEAAAEAA